MSAKEWIKENKHLILWVVIAICAYLLYQKNIGGNLSEAFTILPVIGGAAYGLNFLITLTN